MKVISLFFVLITLPLSAVEREWVLSDGTVFQAQFEAYAPGKVKLQSPDGKSVVMPTSRLSLVDLQYLVDELRVDEQGLVPGYERMAEKKYKPNKKLMKKGEPLTLSYEVDSEIEFLVFESEHFEFWAEGKVDFDELAELHERAWFYNMWNNSAFRVAERQKHLVVLTTTEEGARSFADWLLTHPGGRSAAANEAIDRSWGAGNTSREVYAPIMEERGLYPLCRFYRADMIDFDDEGIARACMGYYSERLYRDYDRSGNGREEMEKWFYVERYDAEYATYDGYYSQFFTDVAAAGGFGDVKTAAKGLAKAMKKGEVKADLSLIYSLDATLDDKEEFAWQVAAMGHFLHSDLRHQLGVARYVSGVNSKRLSHDLESLAKSCGYRSALEINTAYAAYLEQGKFK